MIPVKKRREKVKPVKKQPKQLLIEEIRERYDTQEDKENIKKLHERIKNSQNAIKAAKMKLEIEQIEHFGDHLSQYRRDKTISDLNMEISSLKNLIKAFNMDIEQLKLAIYKKERLQEMQISKVERTGKKLTLWERFKAGRQINREMTPERRKKIYSLKYA